MKKLTLEHIAPYLPYGLKAYIFPDDFNLKSALEKHKTLQFAIEINIETYPKIIKEGYKPLMKSVSWLRTYEGFDKLLELRNKLELASYEDLIEVIETNKYYTMDIQKYKILEEWMCSNHFDWKHNLIEKGLAIDADTLDFNPYNS